MTAMMRELGYIAGQWVGADGGATFPVVNPADGSSLARVPAMGGGETSRAIDAAAAALPAWKAIGGWHRGELLRRLSDLVAQHADELARLMTLEQGKPLAEAKGEVLSGAKLLAWFSGEAVRMNGEMVPLDRSEARAFVFREAVGVVGAITPWNFPHSMVTRKIAPALAAGCTVVLKPAEDTPLSALAVAALAEEAGFPAGVLNVVTAPAERAAEVGEALMRDFRVRKIAFTGSTEVGKILMRGAAEDLKRVSLELGGNAPFLVFESADLERAVEGAISSKFRNAGQTCICANRIFVQQSVADAFTEAFAARVAAMRCGSGLEDGVAIGPMIHEDAVSHVEGLVADALSKGATCVVGGARRSDLGPRFFAPTVLRGAHTGMTLAQEEIFGPVAAIFSFRDEAEAVAMANATPYGLAAFVYTRDPGQMFRVPEALEFGMVGVNEPLLADARLPFGGIKHSGFGREGGHWALDEFTQVRYMVVGGL